MRCLSADHAFFSPSNSLARSVALAIPHDVEPSGGVSETHVTSTIGDTAVKTQTANVGHLQQRVFAKYDLPEREVADAMLAFYHEKGPPALPSHRCF